MASGGVKQKQKKKTKVLEILPGKYAEYIGLKKHMTCLRYNVIRRGISYEDLLPPFLKVEPCVHLGQEFLELANRAIERNIVGTIDLDHAKRQHIPPCPVRNSVFNMQDLWTKNGCRSLAHLVARAVDQGILVAFICIYNHTVKGITRRFPPNCGVTEFPHLQPDEELAVSRRFIIKLNEHFATLGDDSKGTDCACAAWINEKFATVFPYRQKVREEIPRFQTPIIDPLFDPKAE